MKDRVHYLVRSPSGEPGLVFPGERPDPTYVAFGAFFLLASPGDAIADRYTFHAVHEDRLVATSLARVRESPALMRVSVDGVGVFEFRLQPMPIRWPYVGRDEAVRGLVAVRRVRARKPDALNNACVEHKFYFVGFAP